MITWRSVDIPPNNLKDEEKDAFIGLEECVLHMMMAQTYDKLFHPWK